MSSSTYASHAGGFAAAGLRLSVLNAENFRFPAPWTFRPAELPYSILRLVQGGTGEFVFDDERYEVSAGDLVLIPERSILECRSTSPDFAFGSIRFAASPEAQALLLGPFGVPPHSQAGADPIVRESFDAVVAEWSQKQPGQSLIMAGHLAVALGRAMNLTHGSVRGARRHRSARGFHAASRIRDPRIARVLDFLAADLRRTPDPKLLCSLAHMSESTLRRSFKEHTGKTIGEYVREMRLASAARRLAFGDESIRRIAVEVGLPDANYFARAFREVFGLSPSDYRRVVRET